MANVSRVCPINSFWVEDFSASGPDTQVFLPNIGHFVVLCPMEGAVSVANCYVNAQHYVYLYAHESAPLVAKKVSDKSTQVLVCLIAPEFVRRFGEFLSIPVEFGQLLEGTPLHRGDRISECMNDLANATDSGAAEDIFMDIVGQVIALQRARYSVLMSVTGLKVSTQANLVKRLCRARQYIESRFLAPIAASDIAKAVALSEYHFARLFKSAFSITIHQYVMQLRLNFARTELERDDLRITDIALAVGYDSVSAFNTAFKKKFGLAPSKYRKTFGAAKISRI